MTRRVETKGSFAKRQVYAANELDDFVSSLFLHLDSLLLCPRARLSFEEAIHLLLSSLPRMMHLLSRNRDTILPNRLILL